MSGKLQPNLIIEDVNFPVGVGTMLDPRKWSLRG